MKTLFTLLATVLLSGCAFHRTPYVMHEGSPPLSSTAVFASFDESSVKFNDSRIRSADGKDTSCFEVGCPYWVRVLPGKHVFSVRYTANHQWSYMSSGFNYADLSIEVPDMKPGHVYVARYRETGDRVAVIVEDLGEKPKFGITLGYGSVNMKYYPVEF
jgi:hypothetical protein